MSGRYCEAHEKEHRKRQDTARGKTAERGYGSVWRRIRDRVLLEEPLCRFCGEAGEITPATVVDHIDGNSRNNRRENLRSLCESCHNSRTARDQSFGRREHLIRPTDLPRSAVPLTIVCGSPGSGKTTFVRERVQPGDIVIDLDEIRARLSGRPWYRSDREWLWPALKERNRMLRALARPPATVERAWFIVGAPHAEEREAWATMLGTQSVIVLETPPVLCTARIRSDERRGDIGHYFDAAVAAWWQAYTRRYGDAVYRPTDNRKDGDR